MGDFVTGDIVTISDKHCRLNPSLRRSSISRILFLFPSLPLSPFPSASERYGSFLTYFPFLPSVSPSLIPIQLFCLRCVVRSFVRSFPPGLLLPFHYSCSGTNDDDEEGAYPAMQWSVRTLSRFRSAHP